MQNREPTTARKNAQLKQQIRHARCVHPYNSLRWLNLKVEPREPPINYKYPQIVPCVQYCMDCMTIVRLIEK